MSTISELELEVSAARRKLNELEHLLHEKRRLHDSAAGGEAGLSGRRTCDGSSEDSSGKTNESFESASNSLTKEAIERFSRQIVLEDIGAAGMERIRRGRVLLVGAGGLGSTIALYLAAAGVGNLRIVDFDTVERSNLHRQIIHTDVRVGMKKAESAAESCLAINPQINVSTVTAPFAPSNAEELVRDCDIVVDGSDNVATRYLISDAAARYRRPLVSGSALKWEGQLSVYCVGQDGPCYRCLFPVPPPAGAVGSCDDSGVLGTVPGCIGCLQATEVLKLLVGAGEVLDRRLLIFDALSMQLRVVKLRGRQRNCAACGDAAAGTANRTLLELTADRPEYVMRSCTLNNGQCSSALPPDARVTPAVFFDKLRALETAGRKSSMVVVDVRPKGQYDMAHLPCSSSLPLRQLEMWKQNGTLKAMWKEFTKEAIGSGEGCVDVYIICRRGIASVRATEILRTLEEPVGTTGSSGTKTYFRFINVDGGLTRYHHEADAAFPLY
uniref:Adenylyltransferase and sulfurtransferase MOCS3 homolog n=1 Tax=Trypanosoma congolense (strain IL3000) TaxID=1068625 RepID=G0UZK2_TRYCI|nr:putative molybdopterin synthase sulphurylase protein [Trypanosoma congolense IL3000]